SGICGTDRPDYPEVLSIVNRTRRGAGFGRAAPGSRMWLTRRGFGAGAEGAERLRTAARNTAISPGRAVAYMLSAAAIGRSDDAGRPQMVPLLAGLFALGVLCGAVLRLVLFVVLLIVAALASLPQGAGTAALTAAVAIAVLQIGYAAGMIGRARIGAWWRGRDPLRRAGSESAAPRAGRRLP